jgi:hypothetical protein
VDVSGLLSSREKYGSNILFETFNTLKISPNYKQHWTKSISDSSCPKVYRTSCGYEVPGMTSLQAHLHELQIHVSISVNLIFFTLDKNFT